MNTFCSCSGTHGPFSFKTGGGWFNTLEVSFFFVDRGIFGKTAIFASFCKLCKSPPPVIIRFRIQFIIENSFYERADRFMNAFHEPVL